MAAKNVTKRTQSPPRTKVSSKFGHWIVGIVIGLFFSALIFASIQVYIMYSNNFKKMEKLSREMIDLRSAMNIDSVRQYKIQKIMKIIDDHNYALNSMEAYDIASEIYDMSVKYSNLDIDLICAVITHESANSWNPRIVSKAGAIGLMQIMPVTGYFLAQFEGIPWTNPEEVMFDPIYNIRMGSRFLSMLTHEYGLEGGLAAYNGGEKYAALWLENEKDEHFLLKETREYIPAVRKLYDLYQSQGL